MMTQVLPTLPYPDMSVQPNPYLSDMYLFRGFLYIIFL